MDNKNYREDVKNDIELESHVIQCEFDVELAWWQQFQLLGSFRRAVAAGESRITLLDSLDSFSYICNIALACSSAAVMIGYDMNMIGSIISNKEFTIQFGVKSEDGSWSLPANYQLVWNIVQYVCAMAGAFTSGLVSDALGRRVCFLTIIW